MNHEQNRNEIKKEGIKTPEYRNSQEEFEDRYSREIPDLRKTIEGDFNEFQKEYKEAEQEYFKNPKDENGIINHKLVERMDKFESWMRILQRAKDAYDKYPLMFLSASERKYYEDKMTPVERKKIPDMYKLGDLEQDQLYDGMAFLRKRLKERVKDLEEDMVREGKIDKKQIGNEKYKNYKNAA